jgi:hypothetical protein
MVQSPTFRDGLHPNIVAYDIVFVEPYNDQSIVLDHVEGRSSMSEPWLWTCILYTVKAAFIVLNVGLTCFVVAIRFGGGVLIVVLNRAGTRTSAQFKPQSTYSEVRK